MKRLQSRGARFARTVIGGAVASCFVASPALANPTGHTVVNGSASIIQNGNLLQITNSPNAIINWQSFSIGANEITRFIQQSAASTVLNRVGPGASPSQILGTLQSTLANGTIAGRVFLINPNGITFGAGSQIDVGGLVASTLNITDGDFLAGRMRFGDGLGKSLANEGNITATAGGSVYLVGSAVTNKGIIVSPQGEVILAAGNSVELVNPGTPNLRVEIAAADNEARNLGRIISVAGRIGIYAGLINNSGTIRADSAVSEGGRILLKATKNTTLAAGSVTTANGAAGGTIGIQSGDTTLVAGTVEAKGLGSPPSEGGVAPAGDGAVGQGGKVHLLGNLVGLTGNARIDASGEAGGGTVLVGGDFQGKNRDVPNAFRTYFGSNAAIKADAVTSGDGGKVIVWADDVTRAYGTICARGGLRGGNGGFVEVSGKNQLDFSARVDAGATHGAAGTLLLDPQDIVISNTTTTNNNQLNANTPTSGDPGGAIYFNDSAGATFTISDEALEAQTGNIVLQATRDITVNNNLSGGLNLANQGPGERVVMQAGRDITIGSPVTTAGAAIILEADSVHSSSGGANGIGTLTINAAVTSNGGRITLIGGGNPILGGGGIALSENQTIDAGAGGIDIALSGSAPLGIGTLGLLTQILGNPMDELHTTGALRVGTATTAGADGLGTGAQTLLAGSVTNIFPGSAIDLSPATGSSFQLYAGSGGIVLDQPLTTFQNTSINTTGTLAINDPINTSNNNLSITAANVTFGPNGSINTGSGGCSGIGCPVTTLLWDGGGGVDKSWFNPLNWSTNALPTASDDVRIDSGFGTILVSGSNAFARSVIANSSLEVSGTGSLSLTNASQFTQQFTLSGGNLLGSGSASVTGSGGTLAWSGGTMGSGGSFLLGSGSNGTFSNSLTLNRLFENQGFLTLSGAAISGTGSIGNSGVLTAANGTSNTISTPLTNVINTTLGTIQVNGMLAATSFASNAGTINIGSSGRLSTGNAPLINEVTGTIQTQAGGTLDLGASGSFSNSGNAAFGGTYNVATTNVTAGTVSFDGAATTGTLNLSGGTVTGTGDLSVSADFNQSGGTLGTSFSDLVLNKSGNFTVGAAGFTAVDSVTLVATGGITLNGTVTASSGTGDAVVLAGTSFTNNVGPSALNPGSGRWLVWSANPAADMRGGLVYDFKQYDASFGTATVQGAGKGFLYSITPSITPALGGVATKIYDGDALAPTGSLAVSAGLGSGVIDSDTVVLSLAGALYDDRNAGVGKPVTANGIAISSATSGGKPVYGYQLAQSSASANVGEIRKRPLTVVPQAGQGKTYGDDDPAAAKTGYTLAGGTTLAPAGGDSLTGNMGRVAGETVGGYVFTQGSVSVNDGNSGNNYLVAFDGTTNPFQVGARALTATIANQTKVYGSDDPALGGIGVALTGLVNRAVTDINGNSTNVNDTGTVSASLGSLTRAAGESVGSYNITSGVFNAANANYRSPVLGGNPTLAIMPAGLSVTANPQSMVFGATDPSLSFQTAGLVSTSVTDWNGNVTAISDTAGAALTGALARSAGGTVGSYAINQGTLVANGNYALGYIGNTLTITPDSGNFQWISSSGGAWDSPSNWNQGILPLADSIVTISGLPASATITYSSASGTTNLTSISSSASFTVSGGTLNLWGTGSAASSFPSLTLAGGTLAGNGTINAPTLNVLAGGVLAGSRIINGNISNLGGIVAMGASPGTITVNGNYTQGTAGTLAVEIGGTTAGTQFDQLNVAGNVVLDGTLAVTLVNGFVPAGRESFAVIQSGGAVTGAFSNTSFPASPSVNTSYLASSVAVVFGQMAPPAVVENNSQILIITTDRSVTAQAAAAVVEQQQAAAQSEEVREVRKKTAMCNGSSGGGGAAISFSFGGGGGGRCTARGCF